MIKSNVQAQPSTFTAYAQPITLTRCRRWMLFSALMVTVSGTCFLLSPILMVRIMHSVLIGGHLIGFSIWANVYKKVKRDGPIVPSTSANVELPAFYVKAVAFAWCILVAVLTSLALGWSAASVLILFAIAHSSATAYVIALYCAGAMATNLALWWFIGNCWSLLQREFRSPRRFTLVEGPIDSYGSLKGTVECDISEAIVESKVGHWWTSNEVRDEIQGLGHK